MFTSVSGKTMSMPTCEPGQRLLDEQDYVQAYENVREKYKGKNTPANFTEVVLLCTHVTFAE